MLKIRTWHLVLMFVLIISGIIVFEIFEQQNITYSEDFNRINKIQSDEFDSLSSGLTCILFYDEEEGFNLQMEQNLDKVQQEGIQNIKLYKMNVLEEENACNKFKISGVPTVVIYNNGREMKRIMGMVPVTNLKMILNRANNTEYKLVTQK